MTDLLIRNVPDEIISRLDSQAAIKNQSRQVYVLALLGDAASSDYIPTRWGEGYRAFTPSGGKCTLIRGDGYVSGGATELNQGQFDAYKKAKMLADPKNGSRWAEARQCLIGAGFEVWNV